MSMIPTYVWNDLSESEKQKAFSRPAPQGRSIQDIRQSVEEIVTDVYQNRNAAIRKYTEKFDGVKLEKFEVSPEEFFCAESELSEDVKAAICRAAENIRAYHAAQQPKTIDVETMPGLRCWREVRPIDSVGLYVPAGVAPLPSTMLMTAIPAAVAGCKERIACVPPRKDGTVEPSILYAAKIADEIRTSDMSPLRVFKIGGAQAIAAMAYGTETVPKVQKVFGPGNPYVTQAKMRVAQDAEGAAFDMPAGPSEQLHIADDSANPAFVAADLLSQAEHSIDAHVVLLTTSEDMLNQVLAKLKRQVEAYPGDKNILRQSLSTSAAIVVSDLETAVEISNTYAPEHLVLNVDQPEKIIPAITNAGSVFVGAWTPESLGDYASGTNHCLPTQGNAARYSGLTVDAFRKTISFQQATQQALQDIGPTVETLANCEGLSAHANAVTVRLNTIIEERKAS